MPKYNVRLSLYVQSNDPGVIAEFDKRFPRPLEERWQKLSFETAESDLPKKLNQEIAKERGEQIIIDHCSDQTGDCDCTLGSVTTFKATGWSKGPGNVHESDERVSYTCAGSTTSEYWKFNHAGDDHQIYAKARWVEGT